MAIVVPKDGDIISAGTFGIPVANAMNGVISGGQIGGSGTVGNGTVAVSVNIAAANVARKLHVYYHALINGITAPTGDLQLRVNGTFVSAYRFSGSSQEMVGFSYWDYPIAANQAIAVTITYSGTTTVNFINDQTFNRFQWMTTLVA